MFLYQLFVTGKLVNQLPGGHDIPFFTECDGRVHFRHVRGGHSSSGCIPIFQTSRNLPTNTFIFTCFPVSLTLNEW